MSSLPVSPLATTPSLYVVATPLGNLRDITLRALDVLAAVDLIAAEDTRHTRRLLDAHGIGTKMIPAHEHNELQAAERICARLADGAHVALVSDAGTPGVSDPGARIVARVRAAGFRVVPIPGPSAGIAALSAAGMPDPQVHFYGFLPARAGARRSALEALRGIPATLVFYEAPHRIREMLADLAELLEPAREIVVAREISKRFEEIASIPLAGAVGWLAADPDRERGEFVVLVSAPPPVEGLSAEQRHLLALLLAELPVSSAARLAAEITGASRNALYQLALELQRGR